MTAARPPLHMRIGRTTRGVPVVDWAREYADLFDRTEKVRREHAHDRLAIWEAYRILGFDTDGDASPDVVTHPTLAKLIVDAAIEARSDYDEALNENERLRVTLDSAIALLDAVVRVPWDGPEAARWWDRKLEFRRRITAGQVAHIEPHLYTSDSYLHGAEPGPPCVVCGKSRAAHNDGGPQ